VSERSWLCNRCGGLHIGDANCFPVNYRYSYQGDAGSPVVSVPSANTVTIPRDLHELYKEAAERWATNRIRFRRSRVLRSAWRCECCGRSNVEHDSMVVHAADCKAARILGLKREP